MKKKSYFKMFGLNKKATTPTEEIIASHVSSAIPYVAYVNGPADLAGRIIGDNTSTKDYDDSALGYVPGISAYRVQRRRAEAAKLLGADKTQQVNQFLGGLTGTLLGGGIGGGAGALLGKAIGDASNVEDGGTAGALMGAGIGAATGAIAPHLIAGLAALIKRRRTAAEQKEYEQNGGVGNYLIPGMATYNDYKSKGFLMGDEYKQLRQKAHGKNKKKESSK